MVRSKYVIFHSKVRKVDEFIRIKIGSKTIKHENYVKYLGILVDSALTWKPHITQLSKKLSRSVGHCVTPETLKLLYNSLFHSFISYGIAVWDLTHPTIFEPLCKIQKKVVRAITLSDKYSHSSPLFHNLELLKVRDIHSLNLLCFVYECRFHAPIIPFKEFFVPLASIHDYGTRKALKGDLFISGINTTQYGKRTAKYTCSILWNNLDSIIKKSFTCRLIQIIG